MQKKNSTLLLIIVVISIVTIAIVGCQPTSKKPIASDKTTVDTVAVISTPNTDTSTVVIKKDTTSSDGKKSLTVTVDHLTSPDAPVVLGFYTPSKKFLDEKDQLKEYKIKPVNGKFVSNITDLPYGVYAVAIYQDVNSNGKIDKNMLGIPKEPYAFSNNYKPKLHAPSFDDCKFTYSANSDKIEMTLIK